jgi:hypothetical protein
MAICDYCGTSYRGGSVKDGPYRYCKGICRDRGNVLLGYLDQVPSAEVESFIEKLHLGPCESCRNNRNVDVYHSHRIWSLFVYSKFETNSYIACRGCATERQLSDLMFCMGAGWWSPHGFLATPFFIVLNFVALMNRVDPTVPSERFRKFARMELARRRRAGNQFLASLATMPGTHNGAR